MATFVQMSEEDHAYDLVSIINELDLTKEKREEKQKEAADLDEEQAKKKFDYLKGSPLGKLVAAGKSSDVLAKFFESKDKVMASSDDDFEAAFSLAFSVLSRVEAAEQAPLVASFTSALIGSSTASPLLRLSLLGVLFNVLAPSHRFPVYLAILNFSVEANATDAIQGQFQHLEDWTKQWGLTDDQKAEVYLLAAKLVNDPVKTQAHKLTYLTLMEKSATRKSPAVVEVSAEVCLQAVLHFKESVDNHPCYGCGSVTSKAVVKDLAKHAKYGALYELCDIFANKTVRDYTAFALKNNKLFKDLGLDHDSNLTNLRTVTICSMGMHQERLSFKELMTVLELKDDDEVERAVIDAVMSGHLEGKIDQEHSEVIVQKAFVRAFDAKDWAQLATKLQLWKNNMSHVLSNLHNIQLPEPEQEEDERQD